MLIQAECHGIGGFKQLIAPLFDLAWMQVEFLQQLDQRLFSLDRGNSHFRLECQILVPARSLCRCHILARIMLLLREKSTYPTCADLWGNL